MGFWCWKSNRCDGASHLFFLGGIKMKNVDCSLYSGNGKYIMAPSKEWDTIAQYLTDEEIQQICKGYINEFGAQEFVASVFYG